MTSDIAIAAGLGPAGADLYRAAVDGWDLTLVERTALLEIARTLDIIEALQAGLDARGGPVAPDGNPSPLLVELRQQRIVFVRLAGLLDLPENDDDQPVRPAGGLSPTTRAARKAARARWHRRLSAAA